MTDGLTSGDGLGALERLLQFAGQRHKLIVNNIANLDTPGFRPADVSVRGFQQQLGKAIDEARRNGGALRPQNSAEVEFQPDGLLERKDAGNIIRRGERDRAIASHRNTVGPSTASIR